MQALSKRLADLEARVEEKTPTPLWKLFTEEGECRDVLERHVLTKLNHTDLKLFHFVSKESRAAIRRAKIEMKDKRFRIEDFGSTSTLEMAFQRYKMIDQAYFCSGVAKTNNLELLRFVREVLQCRWDWKTATEAAKIGNLEMLMYCVERGCLDEVRAPAVCTAAARGGHLECLRYAHEIALVPLKSIVLRVCFNMNCYKYARSRGCPESSSDDFEEDDDVVDDDDDDDDDDEEEEED